jgi:ubiquinone/menaquinone biosynthesis C-methylase UbiE
MQNSLESLVSENSLHWGEDVADAYHAAAARDMNYHWKTYIEPIRKRHPIEYTSVVDFACGYGRNTDYLIPLSDKILMVDVNEHNVEYCRRKYENNADVSVERCNGYDLSNIADESRSFVYTFDSMVHFPLEIVKAYVPEFYRILKRSGYALVQHSNYTDGGPHADFKNNPHWRNYMSSEIFGRIAKSAGFEVVEQQIHAWGEPDLDCITILRKP